MMDKVECTNCLLPLNMHADWCPAKDDEQYEEDQ